MGDYTTGNECRYLGVYMRKGDKRVENNQFLVGANHPEAKSGKGSK
jgi:hypothetical protein